MPHTGVISVNDFLSDKKKVEALAKWILSSNYGLAVNARTSMHVQATQDPPAHHLKMVNRYIFDLDNNILTEMIKTMTEHPNA